jgi:hypothetical protein
MQLVDALIAADRPFDLLVLIKKTTTSATIPITSTAYSDTSESTCRRIM